MKKKIPALLLTLAFVVSLLPAIGMSPPSALAAETTKNLGIPYELADVWSWDPGVHRAIWASPGHWANGPTNTFSISDVREAEKLRVVLEDTPDYFQLYWEGSSGQKIVEYFDDTAFTLSGGKYILEIPVNPANMPGIEDSSYTGDVEFNIYYRNSVNWATDNIELYLVYDNDSGEPSGSTETLIDLGLPCYDGYGGWDAVRQIVWADPGGFWDTGTSPITIADMRAAKFLRIVADEPFSANFFYKWLGIDPEFWISTDSAALVYDIEINDSNFPDYQTVSNFEIHFLLEEPADWAAAHMKLYLVYEEAGEPEEPAGAAPNIGITTGLRGVQFNPYLKHPTWDGYPYPYFEHWGASYAGYTMMAENAAGEMVRYRDAIKAELEELVENGFNYITVWLNNLHTMSYATQQRPSQGNLAGEPLSSWANTAYLNSFAEFLNDCYDAGINVSVDLVDNRWIPYSIDSSAHIGQPGGYWPVASSAPWVEAADWYTQVITYLEARVKPETLDAILSWNMMGNYRLGASEPVLWSVATGQLAATQQFVEYVWPRFVEAGTRPKGSPYMLPVFLGSWSLSNRTQSFTNLHNWISGIVSDKGEEYWPDYWYMSTYGWCDPASGDSYNYLNAINTLLRSGAGNPGRIISTDFKLDNDPDFAVLLGGAAGTTTYGGKTWEETFKWHIDKCIEYDWAGWWVWGLQDNDRGDAHALSGLKDMSNMWKPGMLESALHNTFAVSLKDFENSTIAEIIVTKNAKIVEPKIYVPAQNGFIFDKWMLGGSPFDYDTPISGNITLTASYMEPYTITFDANGGVVSPDWMYTNPAYKLVNLPTPTRSGYTFDGWFTSGGDKVTLDYVFSGNETITAEWTYIPPPPPPPPATYTVSFNANGGTGTPASQTKTNNITLTITQSKPERENFVFLNWNTAANGSGTAYEPGAAYTANANVTLYAQWSANSIPGGIAVDVDVETGDVTLILDSATLETLIENALAAVQEESGDAIPCVTFDLSAIDGAVAAILDVETAQKLSDVGICAIIILPSGIITLEHEALAALADSSEDGKTPIKIRVDIIPGDGLTGKEALQIKDYGLVVSINVFVGGVKADVQLTISLPYKLKANETAKGVAVWYMDSEGDLYNQHGIFDEETGYVTFTVGHQSYFVTGYDQALEAWDDNWSDVSADMPYFDAMAYGAWYKTVTGEPLFAGDDLGNFYPERAMMRGEMMMLLYKFAGRPDFEGDVNFTDVSGYWTEAIMWAVNSGFVNGYGDGTFGPSDLIPREQIATLLRVYSIQYAGYEIPELRDMPEQLEYSEWAEESVVAMGKAGMLTSGSRDLTEAPTRSEIAQLFMDFIKFIVPESDGEGNSGDGSPLKLAAVFEMNNVWADLGTSGVDRVIWGSAGHWSATEGTNFTLEDVKNAKKLLILLNDIPDFMLFIWEGNGEVRRFDSWDPRNEINFDRIDGKYALELEVNGSNMPGVESEAYEGTVAFNIYYMGSGWNPSYFELYLIYE